MSEMAKQILGRDERFVEIQAWASPSVWTDQMLKTLHRGVERGKWYSLSDKLMRKNNIMEAWEKVCSNKGKHGVDMVSIERYESELEYNNAKLLEELQDGRYDPSAVRRVEIPKGDGRKTRPLGIPTVRDRVVQTALKHVIEPIFDIDFSPYSFGFRPKLGCKDALRRVN
jgi:RNA-directed DNA polymerase